jgi:hypothetical protein
MQTRDHWRTTIISSAISNAALLGWLPHGERDLLKMQPKSAAEPTIGKCRELLERCCRAEADGQPRYVVLRRMDSELWNFMRLLAPSERYSVESKTADLFPPHEDTSWPKATR